MHRFHVRTTIDCRYRTDVPELRHSDAAVQTSFTSLHLGSGYRLAKALEHPD